MNTYEVKNLCNENLGPQQRFNSNSMLHFSQKWKNVTLGLDTACKDGLHPKFEEKPSKGQNKFLAAISWNLVKIVIFKEILAIDNLEMIKTFVLESAEHPNSNIRLFTELLNTSNVNKYICYNGPEHPKINNQKMEIYPLTCYNKN